MTEKMVDMEIEMSDEEFLFVAKMAHDRDITFNQMINKIMEDFIKEFEDGKSND